MATKKLKPTTAGRRDAVVDDFSDITTADPYKPLLAPLTKKGVETIKEGLLLGIEVEVIKEDIESLISIDQNLVKLSLSL